MLIKNLFLLLILISCERSNNLRYENNNHLLTEKYFYFLLKNNSPETSISGMKSTYSSDIIFRDLTKNDLVSIVERFGVERKSNLSVVIFRIESINYDPAYLIVSESFYQEADRFFVGYVKKEYEQMAEKYGEDVIYDWVFHHEKHSYLGEYKSIKINISNHDFILFSLSNPSSVPELGNL